MFALRCCLRSKSALQHKTGILKVDRFLSSIPNAVRSRKMKVTLVGASGELGTPLSLLLHQSSIVDELTLVDAATGLPGLALELNAMDNRAHVTAYSSNELQTALKDSHLVVLAESAVRTLSDTRKSRIKSNAKLAAKTTRAIGQHCPWAVVLVLTGPVSGVFPVVMEVARRSGLRDASQRILGVSAVSASRAATMVASIRGEDPFNIVIPVVGGTSSSAAVPLLSQIDEDNRLTQLEANAVVTGVQEAGERLSQGWSPSDARDMSEAPAMCSAFAAARFADSVLRAISGEQGIHEYAFVATDVVPGVKYVTAPIELCRSGVAKVLPMGPMTEIESGLLRGAVRLLQRDQENADQVIQKLFGVPELPPYKTIPPRDLCIKRKAAC